MKKAAVSCLALWIVILSICTALPVRADGIAALPTGQSVGTATNNTAALSVSADCAVLMDASDGQVLFAQNAAKRHAIASTTKIMTALVALENTALEDEITVPCEAVGVEGSSIYLYQGERLTMEQLLYALLLESANDAATAIAIAVSGSIDAFADAMNQKAQALSLQNTHFTNPHGLSAQEHYSSAQDLAILTAYALKNETFAKIVGTYRTQIPLKNGEGVRLLINHNKLLKSYSGMLGVKTGYTKESGRCLVTAAERDGLRLIAVTLDDPCDWTDHRTMLDYGFSNYECVQLARVQDCSVCLPVVGGKENSITITNQQALSLTLRRERDPISCTVLAQRFLYAPVVQNARIGTAVYYCGSEKIAELPLYAKQACRRAAPSSFWSFVKRMFSASAEAE